MTDRERPNSDAQYIAEQRTVDVLDVLKRISDEDHPVTKKEILDEISTTENPSTLSNTVDEILLQINPIEHTGDNDHEYRIKYEGYDLPYDENPLIRKMRITELRKELRRKGADKKAIQAEIGKLCAGKAPAITKLRYVHSFDHNDMDRLISAVALSPSIPPTDKERLIQKIMDTASIYYSSPFYDKTNRKLRFNPYSEYSRLSSKDGEYEERLSANIHTLQNAIRLGTKIRFRFDVYGRDKCYVSDGREHIISPYYIVIYHDNHYVIGAWDNSDRACHYRIDLMSGIEIIRDRDNNPVRMKAMSDCKDLPGRDLAWDPARYMSEHLYMAYDKPRRMSIKISTDVKNRYTLLHDWHGDNYRINRSATEKCEEGYEVVDVVTSPNMIVHWAMQFGDMVEILDEEVRTKIREELERMRKKYGE